MAAHITENQLVSLVHRLIHLVSWLWVAVVHIALLAILLFALFLFDIKGTDILWKGLTANLHLEETWQILSFFGVSGFACLSAYAMLVKKYAVNFSIDYLWKNIVAQKIK